MGGLLDEIKRRLQERFDAYVASKATLHVVQRERAQLEQIDAKLDRFATRIEEVLRAGEARVESLRRLEEELRAALAELRERPGRLQISGMDELLVLIESVRSAGSGGAPLQETVGSALRRLTGERERRDAAVDSGGEHSVRVGAGVPEKPARPATFGEVGPWRPNEDMRLIEVDLDRDAQ